MRKILYISGTRADFGLMNSTLVMLNQDVGIDLAILVTGMHLSPNYGNTVGDIETSGIRITARVKTELEPTTGATMARAIGTMTAAFVDIFEVEAPDIVLLLGDRGEMLAAAIAAIHLNIPVAHIHGGERSGTVDEPVRHAISKLSHIHFTATKSSAERLVAMGERPDYVIVTGAPGLDGLTELVTRPKEALWAEQGLSLDRSVALLLFHPVLQEAKNAQQQATNILSVLFEDKWQILALMPNADAGGEQIRQVLEASKHPDLHRIVHLQRTDFLGYMKNVDAMIGNSSAGIIEAASFGTPVINIGGRQAFRERNSNIIDVMPDVEELRKTLRKVQNHGRYPLQNVYGDGRAGLRICEALKTVELGSGLMNKVMVY